MFTFSFALRRTLSSSSSKLARQFPTNGEILYDSHPHLLKPMEIMPHIPVSEFILRRQGLFDSYLSPDIDSVILFGYKMRYASGPVFYEFQQSTNILYYTGFDEPNCALILERQSSSSSSSITSTFFCQPEVPDNVHFHGTNVGPDRAKSYFQFTKTHSYSLLADHVERLLTKASESSKRIGIDVDQNSCIDASLQQKLYKCNTALVSVTPYSHQQRLVKSENELKLMRLAGIAGAEGMKAAIRRCKPGIKEALLGQCMALKASSLGAKGLSYAPVIAGGLNALVLHYVKNEQLLKDKDMVLMDAGANYSHYRSDISRTWPICGNFTPAQKKLYGIVLEVHQKCISLCTAAKGNSLNDLHDFSVDFMLNAIKKSFGMTVPKYYLSSTLYPHSIGHFLGLDLHDCPLANANHLPLKVGSVITIEPGLYIPLDDVYFPEECRGIGIRIEDDILIGQTTCENLTSSVPVLPNELEELLACENSTL